MKVFAILKLASPVLDPETRKVVGQTTKELTKVFDESDTTQDLAQWVRGHQAHSCTLLVETE